MHASVRDVYVCIYVAMRRSYGIAQDATHDQRAPHVAMTVPVSMTATRDSGAGSCSKSKGDY